MNHKANLRRKCRSMERFRRVMREAFLPSIIGQLYTPSPLAKLINE